MNCEYCFGSLNSYGSGRFCSAKCARGFSTSKNRKEISQKISQSLKKQQNIFRCATCNIEVLGKRKSAKFCSRKCAVTNECLNKQRFAAQSLTLKKKFANDVDLRNRMREIGRSGGFGTRCETEGGVKCDSKFEKGCFELLEQQAILFVSHKLLPNSSRVCDAYLPIQNLWLEFDGIHREKRYKKDSKEWLQWEGKLNEYSKLGLSVKIFTSREEFKIFLQNI